MKGRKFYVLAALVGAGAASLISNNLAWAKQTVEAGSSTLDNSAASDAALREQGAIL